MQKSESKELESNYSMLNIDLRKFFLNIGKDEDILFYSVTCAAAVIKKTKFKRKTLQMDPCQFGRLHMV